MWLYRCEQDYNPTLCHKFERRRAIPMGRRAFNETASSGCLLSTERAACSYYALMVKKELIRKTCRFAANGWWRPRPSVICLSRTIEDLVVIHDPNGSRRYLQPPLLCWSLSFRRRPRALMKIWRRRPDTQPRRQFSILECGTSL